VAVSKRTRYEVLKRDNHTCRYCGGTAPDVVLTVDHVTPVALGGSDNPGNLVAACKDCNAGKSSTSPNAGTVTDVAQDALQWAAAIKVVAATRAAQREERDAYVRTFEAAWDAWHYGRYNEPIPRPASWRASIETFYETGVPVTELEHCVRIACGNERIVPTETFRYFAGCVWRVVKEMQEAAQALLSVEGVDDGT